MAKGPNDLRHNKLERQLFENYTLYRWIEIRQELNSGYQLHIVQFDYSNLIERIKRTHTHTFKSISAIVFRVTLDWYRSVTGAGSIIKENKQVKWTNCQIHMNGETNYRIEAVQLMGKCVLSMSFTFILFKMLSSKADWVDRRYL